MVQYILCITENRSPTKLEISKFDKKNREFRLFLPFTSTSICQVSQESRRWGPVQWHSFTVQIRYKFIFNWDKYYVKIDFDLYEIIRKG